MFEKIFGIFRKRKQSDVSEAIPGETGEDVFDFGDAGFGDDFEADTISLETGMSSGGFSGSSGGEEESPVGLEEPVGVGGAPFDEEAELGLDVGEDVLGTMPGEEVEEGLPREEPISPLPEVEAYAAPKRKRAMMGAIAVVAVALIGLAVGFFAAKPAINVVQGLLTTGPTPAEQLAQIKAENTQLEEELVGYHAVGTIKDILAVKNELQKRAELTAEISAIENKVADQALVEDRLDQLYSRLDQTERQLIIQRAALANIQKAIKQIEARNNYLTTSTRKHLDQIESATLKSQLLRSRLDPERIMKAEKAASLNREIQEELGRKATEAFPSL